MYGWRKFRQSSSQSSAIAQGVQLGPCETHSKGLENRTRSDTLGGPFERLCLGQKTVFLDLGRKILSKKNITGEIWCASLVAETVKNPPAIWETWVRSFGWEDPWVEGMATRSTLPGESPWTEELGKLQSMRSQRVRHDWATKHREMW